MISLVVGAARELEWTDVEFARSVLQDHRFAALVQDAADEIVNAWSQALEPAQREAAWHRLQALRALLHQLEIRVDHGLLAQGRGTVPEATNPS